jgi:uncharacterized Tic20 family protein
MRKVHIIYTDMKKKYLISILLSLFSVPLSCIAASFMLMLQFGVNYNVTIVLFTFSFNITALILAVAAEKTKDI